MPWRSHVRTRISGIILRHWHQTIGHRRTTNGASCSRRRRQEARAARGTGSSIAPMGQEGLSVQHDWIAVGTDVGTLVAQHAKASLVKVATSTGAKRANDVLALLEWRLLVQQLR